MAVLQGGALRFFREHKNKGPRQPPEANADRESPVRERIIAQESNMKKPLSKLARVPLGEAWKHEANDFTPWLAEEYNLNTLADALVLPDLKLVATEQSQKPQPPNWQGIDIGRTG